jgi:hypothetical protein
MVDDNPVRVIQPRHTMLPDMRSLLKITGPAVYIGRSVAGTHIFEARVVPMTQRVRAVFASWLSVWET